MSMFMYGVNVLLFMFSTILSVVCLVGIIRAGISGDVLSPEVYKITIASMVSAVYFLLNAVAIEG
jgi:hypothetical protein